LPDELRKRGYHLVEIGAGERILAAGIVERFTRRVDGTLEPLTAGSTRPVVGRPERMPGSFVWSGMVSRCPDECLLWMAPALQGLN
jgi:hypothetical protein